MHTFAGGVILLTTVLSAGGCGTARAEDAGGSASTDKAWTVAFDGMGTPAVDAGNVYVLSARHELAAVDARNGHIRWVSRTIGGGGATRAQEVALTSEAVVVGDGDVVAFDRLTGTELWRFSRGSHVLFYVGRIIGSSVLVGGSDGNVYALEPSTGRVQWTQHIGGGETVAYRPDSDDTLVVVGYTQFRKPLSGGVVALDRATGTVKWRYPFPRGDATTGDNAWASGPILTRAFVIVASLDGSVEVLRRESGTLSWSIPPLRPGNMGMRRDIRPLVLNGSVLFVGSMSGNVEAYDIEERVQLWRYAGQDGSMSLSLRADRESVYVAFLSGRLVNLSATDGAQRWTVNDQSNKVLWPPAWDSEHIYVAGTHALVALRR